MVCIAVNKKLGGYLCLTAEFSFNGYTICIPDENKYHHNTGIIVNNGREFAEFCYQEAIDKLTDEVFAHF